MKLDNLNTIKEIHQQLDVVLAGLEIYKGHLEEVISNTNQTPIGGITKAVCLDALRNIIETETKIKQQAFLPLNELLNEEKGE